MKILVNETVKKAVESSGLKKYEIAKKIGVSRNYLLTLLNSPAIEPKHIISIGKAINYNFEEHFPDLSTLPGAKAMEPQESYGNLSNQEIRGRMILLQEKYIQLQEKYIKLLEDSRGA